MYLFSELLPAEQKPSGDETLFELVARLNGPLDDYHPQMLLQCLIWGERIYHVVLFSDILMMFSDKTEIVKEIILNLARALLADSTGTHFTTPPRLPVEIGRAHV